MFCDGVADLDAAERARMPIYSSSLLQQMASLFEKKFKSLKGSWDEPWFTQKQERPFAKDCTIQIDFRIC